MKGDGGHFWKAYKRAYKALSAWCSLRPGQCKQITLIEHEQHDTIIVPPIENGTVGVRLSTNSDKAEYAKFRIEITKLEKYIKSILDGRYKTKTKTTKS